MTRKDIVKLKIELYKGIVEQYGNVEFINKVKGFSDNPIQTRVDLYRMFLRDLQDILDKKL